MSFLNWRARQLADDEGWRVVLSDAAVRDIVDAARAVRLPPDRIWTINRQAFPLSADTREELRGALRATQHGYGLTLIKGLPCRELSEAEFRIACWGVGLYLGVPLPQNGSGDLITDVRDTGTASYRSINGRGYNTSLELDFHIDSGDVVLLFCRRTAKQGGASLVASPFAIIEHLLRENPDNGRLLNYLYPFSLGGYQVDGKDYYLSPLLDGYGDNAAFRINNKNIVNGAIQAGRPLPLENQTFLQEFEALAGSDAFCYRMQLEEGDIQILNNYRVIHSRTAFEDHQSEDERRHLLRLWLSVPDGQPLPPSWLASYGNIAPNRIRGGFRFAPLPAPARELIQEQCRAFGMDPTYAA